MVFPTTRDSKTHIQTNLLLMCRMVILRPTSMKQTTIYEKFTIANQRIYCSVITTNFILGHSILILLSDAYINFLNRLCNITLKNNFLQLEMLISSTLRIPADEIKNKIYFMSITMIYFIYFRILLLQVFNHISTIVMIHGRV